MLDAAQLPQLTSAEVTSLAASVHRTAIEHEAFILVIAADWADRHAPDPDGRGPGRSTAAGERIPGSESARLFGGEGTPLVCEFAPSELGVPLELNTWQVHQLIGDALDLRHRLPKVWRRVLAGEVEAWRARRVAQATRHLDRFAAGLVDDDVDESISRLGWSRFSKVLQGKIIAADPDLAQSRAEAAERARFVRLGRTNDFGLKSLRAQAPAEDVLRLKAQVDRIAVIMAALGDTDDVSVRRSKALTTLADPVLAAAILAASEGIDLSAFDQPADPDSDTEAGTGRDTDTGSDSGRAADSGTGTGTGTDSGTDGDTAPGDDTGSGDDVGSDRDTGSNHDADSAPGHAQNDHRDNGAGKADSGEGDQDADHQGADDQGGDDRGEADRGEADQDETGRDRAGQDGPDQDGPDQNGADQDGADQDRVDLDGADEDEVDQDLPATSGLDLNKRRRPRGTGGSATAAGAVSGQAADSRSSGAYGQPVGPVPGQKLDQRESSAHHRTSHHTLDAERPTDPSGAEVDDEIETGRTDGGRPSPEAHRENSAHRQESASQSDDQTHTSSRNDNATDGVEWGVGLPGAGPAQAMLKALAAAGLDPAKLGSRYIVHAHVSGETMYNSDGTISNGPTRLEGIGPTTLEQFRRRLGPNAQISLKPVIDLDADLTPVDAYEIPAKLRELLRLRHPFCANPWGSGTWPELQLDHTLAHQAGGPAGQTRLGNLLPLEILAHRNKTHGGTQIRQPRPGTLIWRTPNGYIAITDHYGTHNLGNDDFAHAIWRAAVTLNAELTSTGNNTTAGTSPEDNSRGDRAYADREYNDREYAEWDYQDCTDIHTPIEHLACDDTCPYTFPDQAYEESPLPDLDDEDINWLAA